MTALDSLIAMSRALGEPAREYVVIGEGNTSMRRDGDSFVVKASGHQLHNIGAGGFVTLCSAPLLDMLDQPPATHSDIKRITQAAVVVPSPHFNGGTEGGWASQRDAPTESLGGETEGGRASQRDAPTESLGGETEADSPSPSIEASFHAMLLQECGARYIGHTHPTAVNQILCSEFAAAFALQRRFPDEVVLCGPESALVGYADPGLPLAIAMRESVREYMQRQGEAPKVILLANHGLVALGQTPAEVLNITAMTVKAARIYHGALLTGKPTHLPAQEVEHLYRRPDEIYRRNLFVSK